MSDPPVLHLRHADGLAIWPFDEIAMLRAERSGRIEATSAKGEVAHRPGPLADLAGPPWVKVAWRPDPGAVAGATAAWRPGSEAVAGTMAARRPGSGGLSGMAAVQEVLVHPRHVRRRGGRLIVPGGWSIPFEGKLPRPSPQALEPVIPELGVRPDEVRYLKLKGRGAQYWMTDRGRLPARGPSARAAALHPYLLALQGIYVNRRRIRGIAFATVPRLVLDDGTRIPVTSDWRPRVLEALGVPHLRYIEKLAPAQEGLYLLGLRDWPRRIRDARAAELEAMFHGDERGLMANMIWESRELRARGLPLDDGASHRGYWYNPLRPVLQRAGVPLGATPGEVVELAAPPSVMAAIIPPGGADSSRYAHRRRAVRPSVDRYLYFIQLLSAMVGDFGLLTYGELGFEDPRPDLRVIGAARPGLVLLVEKETLASCAFEVARRFGCSLVITRGQPAVLGTEFFAQALALSHSGPVQLVAYVDYDPAGWIIAGAFQRQLARYGVETESVRYLVRPRRFTGRELRDLSYRLSSTREANRTKIAQWVERSGGIGGRAEGISADSLRPVERVVKAFREETGM